MSLSRELDVAAVSAREGEVLAALGEHLTNAEIADRLFISVRTVESHVSSLLRKLGAADRRELARLAAADAGGGAAAAPPGATAVGVAHGPAGGGAPPGPGTTAERVRLADARRPDGAAATGQGPTGPPGAPPPTGGASLPSPLTPFVGRAAERADLAEAIAGQRLVTALGPGGVGKTRLALAVAGDVADRFAGGVWFVELVPVTDRAMIAPAIAVALGLGEQVGRLVEDTVLEWFADRRALLVLDNCEHLVDGVAALVERLLTRCPGVSVLATSRTRLLLPFERPFPVPGLSLGPGGPGAAAAAPAGDGRRSHGDGRATGDDDGDAMALLTARAAAVGVPVTTASDRRRAAAICRALDGMALAIELAASRLPALGLDGLEAGLGDRLRVLTGGGRADERHSSLRATLDWSYDLAEPADRTVLRRVSVFASAFTARAAAEVVGPGDASADAGPGPGARRPAPGPDAVADSLARLADQSLLVVVRAGGETRYRALETVRQYAHERCGDDEYDAVRSRHLAWCLASAEALQPQGPIDGEWRAAFDDVADDLRSARSWAAARPEHRAEAMRLSEVLAALAWHRGRGVEAQHRYEEAAKLAPDDRTRAALLHDAAHAAANRHAGDEAVRLHRRAAELAVASGDDAHAARNLALAATLISRCPGIMSEAPPPGAARELLRRAASLVVGHPEVVATLLVAEAFDGVERDDLDVTLAERAVELARRQGDTVTESAALDHVTAVALARGDIAGAAVTAAHRTELLSRLPYSPAAAYEMPDAYHMASESALGSGDVPAALRFARRLGDLPSHRDLPHLGHNKLLIVHALTGTWDDVPALAERFHEGWVAAGRPLISNLSRGAQSVAFVHAIRGDEDERQRWLAIAHLLRCRFADPAHDESSFEPMLEALVHLHRGEHDAALAALEVPPEAFRRWHTGMSRQWYAAAWAEAGVLAGAPGTAVRLSRARFATAGNPVAAPLVERAAALAEGRRDALPALADALDRAGCPYQAARTRALAGGDARARGEAELAALGATPMPVA